MKQKKYVYKVNKSFYKNPNKYGFTRFEEVETDEGLGTIWAIPIVLERNDNVVKGLIATCNSKSWQEAANITDAEQRKNIFEESGLEFEEKEGKYYLVENAEIVKEFGSARLCVSNIDEPKDYLFIIAADGICRFGAEYIEKCCPQIVSCLLEHKVCKKAVAKKVEEE